MDLSSYGIIGHQCKLLSAYRNRTAVHNVLHTIYDSCINIAINIEITSRFFNNVVSSYRSHDHNTPVAAIFDSWKDFLLKRSVCHGNFISCVQLLAWELYTLAIQGTVKHSCVVRNHDGVGLEGGWYRLPTIIHLLYCRHCWLHDAMHNGKPHPLCKHWKQSVLMMSFLVR